MVKVCQCVKLEIRQKCAFFLLLTKSFLQLDYYYPYFVFRHFYCC